MVGGGISESFDVTTGVLQGGVLAPFFYHLLGKVCEADLEVVTHPCQSRRYPAKSLNDLHFADNIAPLESSIPRA